MQMDGTTEFRCWIVTLISAYSVYFSVEISVRTVVGLTLYIKVLRVSLRIFPLLNYALILPDIMPTSIFITKKGQAREQRAFGPVWTIGRYWVYLIFHVFYKSFGPFLVEARVL